jgi:hypothetical protein
MNTKKGQSSWRSYNAKACKVKKDVAVKKMETFNAFLTEKHGDKARLAKTTKRLRRMELA